MLRRLAHSLLLVLFLGVVVVSCSGLSGTIGSTGGGEASADGAGAGTDTGTSSDSTESLSGTESGLYEDGPVDIPVTIAKLDSVNADLVTIQTADSGALDNLSSPWLIKKLEDSGAIYIVTGATGAVNTEQATKIYGLNTTTGTSVIADVEADVENDGSFEFQISADTGELVVIAPMVEDESEIGPPVYGDAENGVTTLATTNTNALNSGQNLLVDAAGYTYFSLGNSDGTYNLYRRNLDGTSVEAISENIPGQIRFISINDDNIIMIVTQDGKVYRIQGAVSSSVNALSVRYAELSWSETETVHDFGEDLDAPDSYLLPAAKVYVASTGDIFIANGNPLSDGSTVVQEAVLSHVDPVSGVKVTLIPSGEGIPLPQIDMGSQDSLYVFAKQPGVDNQPPYYELFKLNMTDGATAWTNRVSLYRDDAPGDIVVGLDVSAQDMIVFVVSTPFGELSFHNMMAGTLPGLMFTSDAIGGYSEQITVSPASVLGDAQVVTCRGDGTAGSYLVIHRIGVEAPGVLQRISDSTTKNSCHGAYRVDDDGRIMFYRTALADDGTELDPQLSFINLNDIDVADLVQDE